MAVGYQSGAKRYKIGTPLRKQSVTGLARHFYSSAASTMMKSDVTSDKMLVQLAQKIRSEMKVISSDDNDSVLFDSIEAVKHFSWETIWLNYKIRCLPSSSCLS